jgi:Tol biopolymer transport system component
MNAALMQRVTGVGVALLLLVGCSNPTGTSNTRSILFHCYVNDRTDICVIQSDGSDFSNITTNPAIDHYPTWSPDGLRIAFASSRDDPDPAGCGLAVTCSYEIYVMDANGSNVTRVTHEGGGYPVWSPDGEHIAFISDRDGETNLYVTDADGSNAIRLSYGIGFPVSKVWSPDGKRIAFEAGDELNHEIYVVNVDGSGLLNITNNPAGDGYPAWSSDGTQVVFSSWRNEPNILTCIPSGNCNTEIYVVGADGSNPINLTNSPAEDRDPSWSPDGDKIVFTSNPDQDREIYVMNTDGSNQIRLTDIRGPDWNPAWSPDGTRIAFLHSASTFSANQELDLINPDGSGFLRLTLSSFYVWQP